MTATFAKTITEADIVLFAGASGDNNADAHQRGVRRHHAVQGPHRARHAERQRDLGGDRQQAARARARSTCKQTLEFKAPVRAGDTVHAKVTVSELVAGEEAACSLETVCTVRDTVVITGEALVKVGSRG